MSFHTFVFIIASFCAARCLCKPLNHEDSIMPTNSGYPSGGGSYPGVPPSGGVFSSMPAGSMKQSAAYALPGYPSGGFGGIGSYPGFGNYPGGGIYPGIGSYPGIGGYPGFAPYTDYSFPAQEFPGTGCSYPLPINPGGCSSQWPTYPFLNPIAYR